MKRVIRLSLSLGLVGLVLTSCSTDGLESDVAYPQLEAIEGLPGVSGTRLGIRNPELGNPDLDIVTPKDVTAEQLEAILTGLNSPFSEEIEALKSEPDDNPRVGKPKPPDFAIDKVHFIAACGPQKKDDWDCDATSELTVDRNIDPELEFRQAAKAWVSLKENFQDSKLNLAEPYLSVKTTDPLSSVAETIQKIETANALLDGNPVVREYKIAGYPNGAQAWTADIPSGYGEPATAAIAALEQSLPPGAGIRLSIDSDIPRWDFTFLFATPSPAQDCETP